MIKKFVILICGLMNEEEQLSVGQREQARLLFHVQLIALKQQVADDQHSLLPHRLTIVGQPLEQQAQQVLPPLLIGLF